MAIDIKVPSVGESVTEGAIARWLKKDGARVRKDEPLFELETEKATQEVPSPADGVLRVTTKEGATVAIGAVVGRIEPAAAGNDGDGPLSDRPQTSAASTPSAEKMPPTAISTGAAPKAESVDKPMSPAARRLAAEEKVPVGDIKGSGRHGVILKTDVQDHVERHPTKLAAGDSPPASAAPPPTTAPTAHKPAARPDKRERMSAIRQRIADRLLASQAQTASLTTFNEADMSAIMDLRARYKDRFKDEHGVGLGFMSFFVKACVDALQAFPLVNSRIEGNEIVTPGAYNIGVAVSTEKGLMVPVLHHADLMTFAEIEQAIAGLAVMARDGKVSVADLQGGTFTITNGGIFGSMMSTPILNPPQSAILGMHAIQKRPVVRDDAIVIRPMMYLALTYDHRLIDGREAVQFLVRVKEVVENPGVLLLDL